MLKLTWRNCGHCRALDVIVTLGDEVEAFWGMGYGVRGMGYMAEAAWVLPALLYDFNVWDRYALRLLNTKF